MTTDTEAKRLHEEYCRLVGDTLALTLDRMYWWEAWRARGFTVDDLQLVVDHIKRGIQEKRRFPGALKWSNLIQNADRFEEDLIEARAVKRNRKPAVTPKERVIQQARPCVSECTSQEVQARNGFDVALTLLAKMKADLGMKDP